MRSSMWSLILSTTAGGGTTHGCLAGKPPSLRPNRSPLVWLAFSVCITFENCVGLLSSGLGPGSTAAGAGGSDGDGLIPPGGFAGCGDFGEVARARRRRGAGRSGHCLWRDAAATLKSTFKSAARVSMGSHHLRSSMHNPRTDEDFTLKTAINGTGENRRKQR